MQAEPGILTPRKVKKGGPLKPKHRLFAIEYMKDLNATQAAIRAGYSKRSAHAIGNRLLSYDAVRAFLEPKMHLREQRHWLDVERLDRELDRLAFFDPAKLVDPDGRPLPLEKIDEDTRRALAGIEVEEVFKGRGEEREQTGVLRKLRWHNKKEAIELALRRRGALQEQAAPAPVTVNVQLLQELQARPQALDALIATARGALPANGHGFGEPVAAAPENQQENQADMEAPPLPPGASGVTTPGPGSPAPTRFATGERGALPPPPPAPPTGASATVDVPELPPLPPTTK